MADKLNNGGPAFPRHQFTPLGQGQGQWSVEGGMTLRDWFAGQVLAGAAKLWLQNGSTDQKIAQYAYETADAMLAAREAAQ